MSQAEQQLTFPRSLFSLAIGETSRLTGEEHADGIVSITVGTPEALFTVLLSPHEFGLLVGHFSALEERFLPF